MSDEKKVEDVKEEVVAESAEVVEEKTEESKAEVKEAPTSEAVGVPTENVGKAKVEVKEEKKTESSSSAKATDDKKAEISAKFKDLVANLDKLTVIELSELVSALENHWGVSAAAPVAVAAAGGGAAPAEAAEEKTSYDVILASGGDKKIQVIKVVREIKPELGLVDAKNLVEAAPKELLKGVKKEEAEAAKKKLEEAGATVELK